LTVISGILGPVARDSHSSVMFAVSWHILITANACRTQRPSEHMRRYSRPVWGLAATFWQMWISADFKLPVSWWLCWQVGDTNVYRMLVICGCQYVFHVLRSITWI